MDDTGLHEAKLRSRAQQALKSKSEQIASKQNYYKDLRYIGVMGALLGGGVLTPFIWAKLDAPVCDVEFLETARAFSLGESYWHETAPEGCKLRVLSWPTEEKLYWQGNCRDGYAQGNGKLRAVFKKPDGGLVPRRIIYEGAFQQGEATGSAMLAFQTGGIYEGAFEDGVMSGVGQISIGSGMTYKGDWRAGLPNGEGAILFSHNNARLSGEFQDGYMVGLGELTTPEGITYTCNGVPLASDDSGQASG